MNLKEKRAQENKEMNIVDKLQKATTIALEVFGNTDDPETVRTIYGFIKDKKPAAVEVFKARLQRTKDFVRQMPVPAEVVLELHDWVDDTDDEDFVEFAEDFERAVAQAKVAYHPVVPTLEMVLFLFNEEHGDDDDDEDEE